MAAAIAVAAALLSGCGSADGSAARPAPTPTPTATATGPAAAAAAVAGAVSALREANTGRVSTDTRMYAPGGSYERSSRASYDLERDVWDMELSVDTGAYDEFEAQVKGTDGRMYFAIRDTRYVPGKRLPTRKLGRWHRVDTQVFGIGAEGPSLVETLSVATGRKITHRRNGGSIVTGRLSAVAAVGLFGYTKAVLAKKLTEKRLAGTAGFTLYLNAEGTPVRLDVDGADVQFARPKRVPLDLQALVYSTEFGATFGLLGSPVAVSLPKHATKVTGIDERLLML